MNQEDITKNPKIQAGIRLANNFLELEKNIRQARINIVKMVNDWDIVNQKKAEKKKMQVIEKQLAKINKKLLVMKNYDQDDP